MGFSLSEDKGRSGKLRLVEAPYTYARVAAMRSKLVKKDDYNRLMKMKLNEIVKFLQETGYKKEIDEMSVSYSGIDLIEMALNKNLVKTFLKLKSIAEYDELRLLMEEYMKRKDIWNIKTILRGRFTGEKPERIKDLLIPIGEFDEKFLAELMKKESVEDMVKSLKFLKKEQVKAALDSFREKRSLFAIENMLDNHYYLNAIDFAKTMPKEGAVFREFIENEVDVINIKTLLKLKKEKVKKEEIQKFLFFSGARLKKPQLTKLAKAEDIESMVNMLQKLGYSKLMKDSYDKSKKDITQLEMRLSKYLLDKAILLLHKHPLSVDVILGYMFAKEIEIRNLRTIIKGKQLGLRDEFIEKEIITGG